MLQKVKCLFASARVMAFVFFGALMLALGAGSANATDTVTLPDIPVDFSAYATQATTAVGTVLAAIAGLVIIISLTKAGIRWLKGAVAGRA